MKNDDRTPGPGMEGDYKRHCERCGFRCARCEKCFTLLAQRARSGRNDLPHRHTGGGWARSEAFRAIQVVNPTIRIPAFAVMTPEGLLTGMTGGRFTNRYNVGNFTKRIRSNEVNTSEYDDRRKGQRAY
jgi:hypothetical protein